MGFKYAMKCILQHTIIIFKYKSTLQRLMISEDKMDVVVRCGNSILQWFDAKRKYNKKIPVLVEDAARSTIIGFCNNYIS